MTMIRTAAAGIAAGLLAVAGMFVAASDAEARRGGRDGSEYVEWNYKVPGPVHGYSGFAGAGRSSLYCDYQRIPERKCTFTASGTSKCKVVGWTLKQYCY